MATTTQPPTGEPRPLYRAELRPHRSASVRAINFIILGLLAIFIPTAVGFVLAGAWPVTGFMGFELLLLYGALRLNQHRGTTVETIDLTQRVLRIELKEAVLKATAPCRPAPEPA